MFLKRAIRFVIMYLNWSALRRSILIGSLGGPNFSIRTAKVDRLPFSKCFNFDKKLTKNVSN